MVKSTAIVSNDDLNSFRSTGDYICGSSTITTTLGNKPSGLVNAFRLEVRPCPYAPANVSQFIYQHSSNLLFFRTATSGSNWSDWYKIEGVIV